MIGSSMQTKQGDLRCTGQDRGEARWRHGQGPRALKLAGAVRYDWGDIYWWLQTRPAQNAREVHAHRTKPRRI